MTKHNVLKCLVYVPDLFILIAIINIRMSDIFEEVKKRVNNPKARIHETAECANYHNKIDAKLISSTRV